MKKLASIQHDDRDAVDDDDKEDDGFGDDNSRDSRGVVYLVVLRDIIFVSQILQNGVICTKVSSLF